MTAPGPGAASAPDTRVVFDSMVDSFIHRALKGRITPRCKERMRQAGLDIDQKLKPTYPRAVWVQVLNIVVDELFPSRSRDAAFFELGERLVESLKESFMGPAMLAMLRLLGPRRGLERLNHNMRIANNYNQTRLTERGPGDFELWINEASVSPYFIAGTVTAVLKAAGVQSPRVEIAAFDGQAATYRIGF